ncbi:MAG: M48 family metallopeptidase [Methylophilaceae bacterium]|jgi:predicted Zn-dependent protease
MIRTNTFVIFLLLALSSLLNGCATTTNSGAVGVERKQFMMLSEKQVESMSLQSYNQTIKTANDKKTLNTDSVLVERIRGISNRLIAQTNVFRPDAKNWKWEVNVEKNDQVNAYCMPGGKIMVYSGLVDKLKATDDELAAVIGHEISHALREHGRERMSLAYAEKGGLALLAAVLGSTKNTQTGAALGAATLGTQLFFALPNSRTQETEADRMGLELAARAGFNPNAAISLWTKMAQSGGKKPAEFLSDHPSDKTRIDDLSNLIPTVMPLYEQAKVVK